MATRPGVALLVALLVGPAGCEGSRALPPPARAATPTPLDPFATMGSAGTPAPTSSPGAAPRPSPAARSGSRPGRTFYLSPTGDDRQAGTSPAAAWRTFRRASDDLRACDRLLVLEGTYVDPYFHGQRSGRADCPVTIQAAPGATPVLTGKPTYNTYLNLQAVSHVVVEGLTFEGLTGGVGIRSDGGDHVTIRRVTIRQAKGEGINLARGQGHLIEDSLFEAIGSVRGPGSGDAIYLRGVQQSLVAGNRMVGAGHYAVDLIEYGPPEARVYAHHNTIRGNRIEQVAGGGGIGIIRGSHDNLVEGNVIRGAGGAVDYPKTGIQVAGSRNVVRGNVILDTARRNPGLALYAYTFSGRRQDAIDNRIEWNTIARSGGPCLALNQKDVALNQGNVIARNLCVANRQAGARERWRPPGLYDVTVELFHAKGERPWGRDWNGNVFRENWFALADGSWPLLYRDEPQARLSLETAGAWWRTVFVGNRSGRVELDAEGRPPAGSPPAAYGAHAPPPGETTPVVSR